MIALGVVATGIIALGTAVLVAPPALATPTRLAWDTTGPAVSWHSRCAFAHGQTDEHPGAHRFVVLEGSLRSLARNDAALYAVYLDGTSTLATLRKALAGPGTPGEILAGSGFRCEWLPLGVNGEITLRVDEADVPGMTRVAVVNAEGEILDCRPLWKSSDLASVHSD
jgi:hypothetical protein